MGFFGPDAALLGGEHVVVDEALGGELEKLLLFGFELSQALVGPVGFPLGGLEVLARVSLAADA